MQSCSIYFSEISDGPDINFVTLPTVARPSKSQYRNRRPRFSHIITYRYILAAL